MSSGVKLYTDQSVFVESTNTPCYLVLRGIHAMHGTLSPHRIGDNGSLSCFRTILYDHQLVGQVHCGGMLFKRRASRVEEVAVMFKSTRGCVGETACSDGVEAEKHQIDI